jgi:hypothetical protein
VTVVGPRDDYTLTELAQGVDLPSSAPEWATAPAPDADIGPNCDVFNRSRRRVYAAVESYRERRDRHGFKRFVRMVVDAEARAYERRNARHVRAVHLKSVAKSIETWSWDCYKRGSEPVEARRTRSKRSRCQYLSEIAEKRLEARRRRDGGATLKQIAAGLGVSKSSVCNYLAATRARCPRSNTSEIAPARAGPVISPRRATVANFAKGNQHHIPDVLHRRGIHPDDLSRPTLTLCAIATLRLRPVGPSLALRLEYDATQWLEPPGLLRSRPLNADHAARPLTTRLDADHELNAVRAARLHLTGFVSAFEMNSGADP